VGFVVVHTELNCERICFPAQGGMGLGSESKTAEFLKVEDSPAVCGGEIQLEERKK